jgi:hypothetical protein
MEEPRIFIFALLRDLLTSEKWSEIPKCLRNIPHALRIKRLHMILRSTQTPSSGTISLFAIRLAFSLLLHFVASSDLTFIIGSRTGGALTMKLTTTMMAVAALCTLASGCVSTQTAADRDRANTLRLKVNAAQDEGYLNP